MNNSKIIEKNKKSIILLDVVTPQDNKQNKIRIVGSGFIILEDGKFITCAHVYKQIPENEKQYLGAKIMAETNEKGITNYKSYKVKFLEEDKENDIALMQLISENNEKFTPIEEFGDAEFIKEGNDVMILGFPLALELIMMGFGITLSANKCIISSVKRRGEDGSLHYFIVDTHINNGSSGSPMFLVDTGKVVGMACGRISNKIPLPDGKIIDVPANMGICRPGNYIIELMNKYKLNN